MFALDKWIGFDVASVRQASKRLREVDYENAVNLLLGFTPDDPGATPALDDKSRIEGQDSTSVDPPRKLRKIFTTTGDFQKKRKLNRVEACSSDGSKLVPCDWHPFVAAVHMAFSDHRPLVISPDMIWLLIAQAFANHVNANSQALRSQFVSHEGKAKITVCFDHFVKGSPHNDWPRAFATLSEGVRSHIGAETHNLILPRFSTTGPVERAAAEVALLDAMQSYFDYVMVTICGIPRIYLQGTVDDWKMIAQRAQALAAFGLQWWVNSLEPILQEFVRAAEGKADRSFWKSIYKLTEGYGKSWINGWITLFFPYLRSGKGGPARKLNNPSYFNFTKNRDFPAWIKAKARNKASVLKGYGNSIEMDQWFSESLLSNNIPLGLASAPLTWIHPSHTFQMEMMAGFVGVRQDSASLALRPEIGWAVRETALT